MLLCSSSEELVSNLTEVLGSIAKWVLLLKQVFPLSKQTALLSGTSWEVRLAFLKPDFPCPTILIRVSPERGCRVRRNKLLIAGVTRPINHALLASFLNWVLRVEPGFLLAWASLRSQMVSHLHVVVFWAKWFIGLNMRIGTCRR